MYTLQIIINMLEDDNNSSNSSEGDKKLVADTKTTIKDVMTTTTKQWVKMEKEMETPDQAQFVDTMGAFMTSMIN